MIRKSKTERYIKLKKKFFKHVRVFLPSVKVGELINKWTKCGGFEIEEIRNQQAFITDL